MKIHSISEGGQVLVIIAVAIIGLVGITGLAIDGSMVLMDRRHAQNAADTAALAGALAKMQAQTPVSLGGSGMSELDARDPMRVIALDRAESNGYFNNLVTSTVEVYTCDETALGADCPDPYDGDPEYVQVVITSHVDTFFARVVGIETLTNRVQAVALADYDDSGSLFGGAGIVSLNPDCPNDGSLKIGGDADIYISGGGMFSNSDDACAVKCSTSAGSLTICNEYDGSGNCIDEGLITTAGGLFTFGGQCQTNMTGGTSSGGSQMDYHADIPDLPEPPECDSSDPDNYSSHVKAPFVDPVTGATVEASYIGPGYYNSFPPKKVDYVNTNDTMVLAPGIYCVDSVLKQVTELTRTYGDDVTIYVRQGNDIRINGGVIQLRAMNGDGAPYGPHGNSNEEYYGYLFIAAPDYEGPVTSCSFEGNAVNIYEGAIFAPHCDVTINGTADTPPDGINAQIIGYNVTINGGANLYINYDSDKNPYISDPSKTGITK